MEIPNAKATSFDDAALRRNVDAVLKAREKSIADKRGWSKFGHAIESIYTIFSPFAKNFLTVAIAVCHSSLAFALISRRFPVLNPYGLVASGLFLLIAVIVSLLAALTVDCG